MSNKGITPGTKVLSAIRDFPEPTDNAKVRSFLGTTNFCRRFIKGYATIAKPLTDLFAKSAKFVWRSEQKRAFETLKQLLLWKPVLAVYEPTAETEVHTDASQVGLDADLIQKREDRKFHPVRFCSRKTTKHESKYHSYK